jgi:putative hydrolase of the HAD superfamily
VLEQVELITLDLDDTLWPCFPVIQAAEQELYAWLGEQAPQLTEVHDVASLRAHRMQLAERHPGLAHDLTGIRLRSLCELADTHGLDPQLPRLAIEVFRRARNRVTPYDEVRDVLHRLRERFVLVAVSNGNAQVAQTPLAGCFHHSFMAEEVGAAKPEPALFLAASEASGIGLERALHVGDDPVRDIAAARDAGMRTAWVNRDGAAWPEGIAGADLQVDDLRQLVARLLPDEST